MDFTANLNEAQRLAVEHTDGPLLILAGAGSGKTRVLTHRIARLISLGVPAFNIIAITFTNKAAREMKERVEKLVESGADVWVATFHSTCVRILRREITKIGYDSNFTIYDADDSEKLMKDVLKELNVNEKLYPPKSVLGEIGRAKDELVSPQEYLLNRSGDIRGLTMGKLYEAYQKKLKNSNALDFDDLIFKTAELFVRNPDVLEKYRNRFKYISVDEYQDTNRAQYELIKFLAGTRRNLCVVGDDDQSIYGWRGADIRNILDFEKDYPNARVIKLEQNYRSVGNILEAANAVIKNNTARKAKQLWTESGEGQTIKLFRADSESAEAAFVAREIKTLRAEAKAGEPCGVAVLYRTNAQSRALEDQLVKQNVPYRVFGGVRFYQRKEIKDALAYLKAVSNPLDEVSVKRIINYPKRGIGQTTIDRLTAYAAQSERGFYNALRHCAEITDAAKAAKISAFTALLEKYAELSKTTPVTELIRRLLDEIKMPEALTAEGDPEGKDRLENLQELLNKAHEFEKLAERPFLNEFLEEVALVADIDNLEEKDEACSLMTIHSAKGLEFDAVFLTGFEESVFPGMMTMLAPEENAMEEERRLCYVAITRARERLYITYANERMRHGETNYNKPSRFLKELPAGLCESLNAVPEPKAPKSAADGHKGRLYASPSGRGEFMRLNNYRAETRDRSIPAPVNISLDYAEGDSVSHVKYGTGVVRGIRPAGADYEVSVAFPGVGVKKFMSNLAKLTRADAAQ